MRTILLSVCFFLFAITTYSQSPEGEEKFYVKHLNLITNEEEILTFNKNEFKNYMSSSSSPSFKGEIPNFDISGSLKSLDLLATYTQTPAFPESAILYLLNDLNGLYYTGTLINPKYVLTGAFDIYSARGNLDRLYATSYNYIRGLETEHITWATDIYFFTNEWKNDNDWENNIALIKLNRPLGATLGHMGYGYQAENSFFEENNFFVTLIEEGTYNLKKFDATPDIYRDESFLFEYQEFAIGAPFYRDNGILYGVISFDMYANNVSIQNGATRITQEKFNTINNIISDDMPTSPDLMPLMVNVKPSNISAAQELEDITFYLHNYSSETFSGQVEINIRLSENNQIDENDPILITYTANITMEPLQTFRFQPTDKPVIPVTITSGEYFIGASITTNDFDANNNYTNTYDCDTIQVTNAYASNYIKGDVTVPNSSISDGYCILYGYNNDKINGIYDIVLVENGNYEFNDVFLGKYLVEYIPSLPGNNTVVPTYFGNTAYWDKSTSVTVTLSDTVSDVNITAIKVEELSGTKSITGYLQTNSVKSAENENEDSFFDDVLVFLTMSESDSVISFCQPDENGNYHLSDLEPGTWKVDIGKPGFSLLTSHTVNLTQETDTVKNINYEFSSDSTIRATNINAVKNIETDFELTIYPNPTNKYIEIGISPCNKEFVVEIFNLTGKKMKEYDLPQGTAKQKIDISFLLKGSYLISVYSENKMKKSQLLLKQ